MKKHILFLTLSLLTIISGFGQIPTNGLVAWYPFNGNANDESGNGNNGTINDATLTTDRFGNPNSAYNFDGTNDKIQVPSSPSLNFTISQSFTINVWVKLNGTQGFKGVIVKATPDGLGSGTGGWQFMIANDTLYSELGGPEGGAVYSGNYNLNTSSWHQVTFVVDRLLGKSLFYVDGVFDAELISTAFSLVDVSCSYPLYIGTDRNNTGGTFFNGLIDDIRIYNRALSDTEIFELYNEGQSSSLTADFSATPIEGVAPLNVQFTDESTGNPTVWLWDFQNDGVYDAFIQNPSFTFDEPGDYSVKLLVINSTESDTIVKVNYITVNQGSTLEGLVAYYPFNDNANDESGNMNNGTANGAILTTDRFDNPNSAYYFNGSSEIRVPNSSSLSSFTDQYTISVWTYITQWNNDNMFAVMDKTQPCPPTAGTTPFLFSADHVSNQGYVIQNVDCNGPFFWGKSNEPAILNTWTHTVAVYNGSDIKMYVNGILKFTNPATGNIATSTGDLTLGRITFGWGHYAFGKLDDIRIYNSALSDSEILELYNENQITTPEICIVSVTPEEHNQVIWEKPFTTQISTFNVYRESTQANVYEIIGSVAYEDSSIFVDMNSNPQQRPYKYKISAVSTTGNETGLSNYHKTIHLTINQGPTGWNLIWSPYEGFPYSTYYIYRGTTPNSLSLFDSISSSFTSYTDIDPPLGSLYYAVEVVNVAGCNPTRSGGYDRSRSNVQFNGVVGILDNPETGIKILPNPTTGKFILELYSDVPTDNVSVEIYGIFGEKVLTELLNGERKHQFSLSDRPAGVYFIRVITGTKIKTIKVIKQ